MEVEAKLMTQGKSVTLSEKLTNCVICTGSRSRFELCIEVEAHDDVEHMYMLLLSEPK